MLKQLTEALLLDHSRDGGIDLPLTGRLIYPKDDRVLRFLREGWFEYRELALVAGVLRPGDCFLDIGAHCGLYSRLAQRVLDGRGTIVTVEPNLALHEYIHRNVGGERVLVQEAIEPGTINLVAAAVAAEAGTAVLQTGESGWTAYSTLQSGPVDHVGQSVDVATRPLQSLIAEPGEGGIVFAKLDTEGFEHDILAAALPHLQTRNDLHLLVEFDEIAQSRGGRTTDDLRDLVESAGYVLAELDSHAFRMVRNTDRGPLWGANLIVTRDLDVLNRRLSTLDTARLDTLLDFIERGKAAETLRERSEKLDTAVDAIGRARAAASSISMRLTGKRIETSVEHMAHNTSDVDGAIKHLQEQFGALESQVEWQVAALAEANVLRLLHESEAINTASALADLVMTMGSAVAKLENREDGLQEVRLSVAALSSEKTQWHLERLLSLAADQAGMLIGASNWIRTELESCRADKSDVEKAMTTEHRLVDLVETIGRATAQLEGRAERLDELHRLVAELDVTDPETRTASLLELTADQAGILIGVANWMSGQLATLENAASGMSRQIEALDESATHTQEAQRFLRTARLDTASAIAAVTTHADKRRRQSDGADVSTVLQRVKGDLTSADWHLSVANRIVGSSCVGTDKSEHPDDIAAELSKVRSLNRELTAEINRLGILIDRARSSQWLKLGGRIGADVTRQLDAVSALVADIRERS